MQVASADFIGPFSLAQDVPSTARSKIDFRCLANVAVIYTEQSVLYPRGKNFLVYYEYLLFHCHFKVLIYTIKRSLCFSGHL